MSLSQTQIQYFQFWLFVILFRHRDRDDLDAKLRLARTVFAITCSTKSTSDRIMHSTPLSSQNSMLVRLATGIVIDVVGHRLANERIVSDVIFLVALLHQHADAAQPAAEEVVVELVLNVARRLDYVEFEERVVR